MIIPRYGRADGRVERNVVLASLGSEQTFSGMCSGRATQATNRESRQAHTRLPCTQDVPGSILSLDADYPH